MLRKNQKKIVGKTVHRKNVFSKAIGLLFRTTLQNEAHIFHFNRDKPLIHMFFVFTPIDIICIDQTNKVIEIKEDLKPFQTYQVEKPTTYLIELPSKIIQNHEIQEGDKITFS